jgi:alginate O-acetyltransferase complex protein AlgI
MLFNSLEYLVFFPVVVALHFVLPHRYRHFLLLAASYLFYMSWNPAYAILMVISTFVDYFVAMGMEGTRSQRRRSLLLSVSLAANFGLLFTFKYYNFFRDTVMAIAAGLGTHADLAVSSLLLPVGISFYTFQTVSYTVDVYRGTVRAERDPVFFALYVSYFPQLVAGPIERPENLLPQIRAEKNLDLGRVAAGLKIMLWGYFKKVVVADRAAAVVNAVYAEPASFGDVTLVVATFLFGVQIYCDFSGYSDIAIGSARAMGVRLMRNFDRPYWSPSIAEFWRRWHISLSTWFRDYVYIPLGGNRVPLLRRYFNLFMTFLLSGLWHGANWTFVVWGALHGAAMVASDATARARDRVASLVGLSRLPALHRAVRIAVTYVFVSLTWIFFRARSMADAFVVLRGCLGGFAGLLDPAAAVASLKGVGMLRDELVLLAASIAFVAVVELVQFRVRGLTRVVSRLPALPRWALYGTAVSIVLFLGYAAVAPEFIYFQF